MRAAGTRELVPAAAPTSGFPPGKEAERTIYIYIYIYMYDREREIEIEIEIEIEMLYYNLI